MHRRVCGFLLLCLLPLPAAAGNAAAPAQPAAPAPAAPASNAKTPAPPAPNVAADAAREKAIAEELAGRVRPDQAVWLDAGGTKVLALYDEDTTGKPRGAAVILHGIESSADMEGIIHALRTRLPNRGWTTLSVQLPVLPPGSPRAAYGGTLEAAGKRLKAALAYLKAHKSAPIAVIGYELGAAVALRDAAGGDPDLAAVVALDLSGSEGLDPPADANAALEKTRVPVLDLYGSVDTDANLKQAPLRAAIARKAKNQFYRQVRLAGADDHFTGMESTVVRRVGGWLDKAARQPAAAPPP